MTTKKRPYRPTPAGRIAHAREARARREASSDGINRLILESMKDLTPPPCKECSTLEILGALASRGVPQASMRGIGSRLGLLRKEGLVTSSMLAQRHLWSLSAKGRGVLSRPAR